MVFLTQEEEQSLWKRLYGKFTVAKNGCWLYLGNKPDKYGYTYLSLKNSKRNMCLGTYRAMYALFYGLPEKGLMLDHLCRTPQCINPKHLEPVTSFENQRRSPISIYSKNKLKTHCDSGHELTKDNIYVPPKRPTRRYCRACRKELDRLSRLRLVAA